MLSTATLRTAAPSQPVLLACLPNVPPRSSDEERLLERVRATLGSDVRVMHISEATHPEVVRSFGLTQLPAFVLVKQGLELWRYVGPLDPASLLAQLAQLSQTILNPQPI